MKNLYGAFKQVINECGALNSKEDYDVIARLKMTLSFETEDKSYEYWMKKVAGICS